MLLFYLVVILNSFLIPCQSRFLQFCVSDRKANNTNTNFVTYNSHPFFVTDNFKADVQANMRNVRTTSLNFTSCLIERGPV